MRNVCLHYIMIAHVTQSLFYSRVRLRKCSDSCRRLRFSLFFPMYKSTMTNNPVASCDFINKQNIVKRKWRQESLLSSLLLCKRYLICFKLYLKFKNFSIGSLTKRSLLCSKLMRKYVNRWRFEKKKRLKQFVWIINSLSSVFLYQFCLLLK